MKIFLDTANVDEIRKMNDIGIVDGVTTNPSLIAKEGKEFESVIKEIVSIVDGPISAEVISLKADEMVKEARVLSKIHKNVVIKIPTTPDGLKATHILEDEGIHVNVTLCFSSSQALLVAKAGASYVSPFVGRIDDISSVGMDLITEIRQIYNNYDFNTEIIVASVRSPIHAVEAALAGADIATIPYKVLDMMFRHPLTDRGIEKFLSDWNEHIKKT
ncbi:MAG: fructose-6-phosphate aldolase [Candidatus Ancaeobacter aquaticus]|nr:fructose-6-phosphate aldolase [Candidatus Ancaeobacter aquaticus]